MHSCKNQACTQTVSLGWGNFRNLALCAGFMYCILMRWQSELLSWSHGSWLCWLSRHRRWNLKTNEWWHSLSCCCCPMGVVPLHAVFVIFSAAFMLWTELEYLTWTKMSDGNVTSEQSAAGCNIVQTVVTQALWEALEQRTKYPSNSIAITPRLKKQQTYSFLLRGSLLFSTPAPALRLFFLCLCVSVRHFVTAALHEVL